MNDGEVTKLYRLARRLAFVYRPFHMDIEDAVQEYVMEAVLAADKCPTWCWAYLYKSMYNKFLRLLRTPSLPTVDIDDTTVTLSQILPIPIPKDKQLARVLLAVATYPTWGEAFNSIGLSYNEGHYLLRKAKAYVQEHLETL